MCIRDSITGMNLSAEVLKHQPMVEKYAREYGISEYVNVLLAIIQVESGGTAEDVMQSSESLGLPPNSLDTESSIKQGCKYFADVYKRQTYKRVPAQRIRFYVPPAFKRYAGRICITSYGV